MLILLQVEKNYKKEVDKNYIRESSMKNSVKLMLLAGMLQVGYGKAMDLQDDNRLGNVPGNQTEQQSAISKQQVLNKVNYQLKLLQRQAATIQDPQLAKELVAQTLAKIAALTGDASVQDLYSVVDQAIDIADQDIKEQSSGQVVVQAFGDGPSFGQAFYIIATGIGSAVVTALGASVGAIGGGFVSAGIALATPGVILSTAYNAATAPAPYGAINSRDGIGTAAAKLLPNILSRALNVVLSTTACAAVSAITIVAMPIVGAGSGAAVANMNTDQLKSLNRNMSKFRDDLERPRAQVAQLESNLDAQYASEASEIPDERTTNLRRNSNQSSASTRLQSSQLNRNLNSIESPVSGRLQVTSPAAGGKSVGAAKQNLSGPRPPFTLSRVIYSH
jgi:hypothetical protein